MITLQRALGGDGSVCMPEAHAQINHVIALGLTSYALTTDIACRASWKSTYMHLSPPMRSTPLRH